MRKTSLKTGRRIAVIAGLLLFVFTYPRFLLSHLSPGDPWLNFLYHYGFGLIAFGVGIWVILAERSCRPERKRDRFWLKVLFVGFIAYATVHAFWIYAAQTVTFLGGGI